MAARDDAIRRRRRSAGLTALVLVALALAAWALYRTHGHTGDGPTRVDLAGMPVVMRTPGGLLEVATVSAQERFTREDTKQFWGIPLGTTVSWIQATVVYRYHIQMQREWPLTIVGKTCIVRAGEVKPSLPVAFDTAMLRKYTRSGWARFDKAENLLALERSMTPELAIRATSPLYLRLATDAGRQTVAEFVTTWLLKERQWRRDPDYRVVVLFPGEPTPGTAGAEEAAAQR